MRENLLLHSPFYLDMLRKKLKYVEKRLELKFRKRTSAVWVWLSRSCYPAVFRNAFRESPFFCARSARKCPGRAYSRTILASVVPALLTMRLRREARWGTYAHRGCQRPRIDAIHPALDSATPSHKPSRQSLCVRRIAESFLPNSRGPACAHPG